MQYTRQVVKEVLRYRPPAPMVPQVSVAPICRCSQDAPCMPGRTSSSSRLLGATGERTAHLPVRIGGALYARQGIKQLQAPWCHQ